LNRELKARRVELATERSQLVLRLRSIEQQLCAIAVLLGEVPSRIPAFDATRMTVAEACAYILAQEARPMHVSELTSAIISNGVRLKSKTPARSVAAMLNRNIQFIATAPGTFILAEEVRRANPSE
jgi:hypothetical protein